MWRERVKESPSGGAREPCGTLGMRGGLGQDMVSTFRPTALIFVRSKHEGCLRKRRKSWRAAGEARTRPASQQPRRLARTEMPDMLDAAAARDPPLSRVLLCGRAGEDRVGAALRRGGGHSTNQRRRDVAGDLGGTRRGGLPCSGLHI